MVGGLKRVYTLRHGKRAQLLQNSRKKRCYFFINLALSYFLTYRLLLFQTLEKLLQCLWDTEHAMLSGKSNRPMFASDTTLKALRVSILSTISLTEELFSKKYGYKYVLSGKWNQDCIEVVLYHLFTIFSF